MNNNYTHFEKVSLKQFQTDLDKKFSQEEIVKYYENIKLPKRATTGSAGYDFYLPFDVSLKEKEAIIIPTGIRCQMNKSLVLQIYPRSSLGFKYHLELANTVGIIDNDYYEASNEGHIQIKLINNYHETINLKQGEAFVQGLFVNFYLTCDDEVDKVRTGGIGSTNSKI